MQNVCTFFITGLQSVNLQHKALYKTADLLAQLYGTLLLFQNQD